MTPELEERPTTGARADAVAIALRWGAGQRVLERITPVSFGVMLPRGKLTGPGLCRLQTPAGESLPGQCEPLGHWPDSSVRWLLVDAVVPAGTACDGDGEVVISPGRRITKNGELQVSEGEQFVLVASDRLHVKIHKQRGSWQASLDEMTGDEDVARGPLGARRCTAVGELPQLTDCRGRQHAAVVRDVRIVTAGPVRATIEVRAEYPHVRGLRLSVRWSFFAGTGLALADVTLHNPRRARHLGGLWDLGDAGSVTFRDFSLPVGLATAEDCRVWYRCETSQPWKTAADGCLEIYQESSGGENWNSRNHLDRNGKMPLRFRGYRGRAGEHEFSGERATPLVVVESAGGSLSASIDEFWQQFPKAMEVDGCRLTLRLFPRQTAEPFELQGGEQKTQRVAMELSAGSFDMQNRVNVPLLRVQPAGLSDGNATIPALPSWEDADPAILARVDELAEEFLEGSRGLLANRERVDEYGWRNYGDVHADHEELHYHGRGPLISHYNNQFDLLGGFLLQFLRTGEVRWMELADSLARHVIDIDIYHTTEDRPAYNGGLFWFTDHYLHAETATHRTYSQKNKSPGQSYGGGPGSAHNFTTGLLLYHMLTGCPRARAAVCGLADWVIAMDDGSQTVLGLLDDGPTGLATPCGSGPYHSPERGAGNSLNALLDGWLITSDRKYLDYAGEIVRRCIHPHDDIPGQDLLDAEKRWSYTVFLVSLDKYLRCKAELDEIDEPYAYAQACLVHYGRWMLTHERPYFDRREKLEYPTEAWAAQEFRKANALRLAAQYAPQQLAMRMFDRGDELAERAWKDLFAFETRTAARAMAVLLIEGPRDAELRRRATRSLPDPPPLANLSQPQPFVSQRERVKRQLRSPKGVVSLLVKAANPIRWPRLFKHY
jgi:YetA-like protein